MLYRALQHNAILSFPPPEQAGGIVNLGKDVSQWRNVY